MGRTVPNRAAAYSLTPRATYSARTFGGSTWQALKDTAQTPGGNDWQLVARGGSDAFMPKILGNYSAEKDYRCLDIVALDGSSFIACCDFPGKCPGKEWQLLAGVGPPGPQDPQGEKANPLSGRLASCRSSNRGARRRFFIKVTYSRAATAASLLADNSGSRMDQTPEIFHLFASLFGADFIFSFTQRPKPPL